jgi:tape measure domain-containing protein
MAVKNVTFSIKADTTSFKKDLDDAKKGVEALNTSLTGTTSKIDSLTAKIRNIASAFTGATIAAEEFKRSLSGIGEVPGFKNFTSNARKAASSVKDTTTAVGSVDESFRRGGKSAEEFSYKFKNIKFDSDKAAESLKRTARASIQSANESTTAWTEFTRVVRQARLIYSAIFLSGKIKDLAFGVVEAAGKYQQLNIAFSTFLGSAEKAKIVLKELQEFSVKTPFTSEQVQQSARVLLAYGFTAANLIPNLEMLGDVASATGVSLQQVSLVFGQIKAAGKLMGQDLLQLVNAGFNPLQEISERTGESMASLRKRMGEGKISFKEVEKSFIAITAEGGRFNELTKEFGESFLGRVSTLQDNIDILKRGIGEALLPSFTKVTEVLIKWGEETNKAGGFIKVYGKTLLSLTAIIGYLILQKRGLTASYFKETAASIAASVQKKKEVINRTANINAIKAERVNLIANTTTQNLLTKSTVALNVALKSLWATFLANPLGIVLLTATALYELFGKIGESTDELDKNTRDLSVYKTWTAVSDAKTLIAEKTKEELAALEGEKAALQSAMAAGVGYNELLKKLNEKYGTNIKVTYAANSSIIDLNATNIELESTLRGVRQEIERTNQIDEYSKRVGESKIELEGWDKRIIAVKNNIAKLKKELGPKPVTPVMPIGDNPKQLDDYFAKLQKVSDYDRKVAEIKRQETVELRGTEVLRKKEAQNYSDFLNRLQSVKRIVSEIGGEEKKYSDILDDIIVKRNEAIFDSITLDIEVDEKPWDDFEKRIDRLNKLSADSASQISRDTQRELQNALDKNAEDIKNGVIGAAEDRNRIEPLYNEILEQRLYQNHLRWLKKKSDAEIAEREKTIAALKAIEERKNEDDIDAYNDQLELVEGGQQKSFDKMSRTLSFKRFNQFKAYAIQQKESIDALLEVSRAAEKDNALIDKLDAESKTTNKKELENINKAYNSRIAKIDRDYDKKKRKNAEDTEKSIEDLREEKIKAYIDLVQTSLLSITQVSSAIVDAEIALSDRLISEQEKRVNRAREIADRGNAEMLQREQEKYDTLIKQRQKFVNQQKAITIAELVINQTAIIIESIRTITREGASKGVPGLIGAVAALAVGIAAAQATAQQAMAGGFETGGYTGDGHQKEPAGIVHKGEFVFTKEKTQRYRPLFEEIHKGRDPYLAMGVNDKIIVVNNHNMDSRLERIEKAILGQNRMQINIDERGIHGIVSQMQFKKNRLNTRF